MHKDKRLEKKERVVTYKWSTK